MRKGKIFIGLNNIAGVAISLKNGFEELGYKVDYYSAEKNIQKYHYTDNTKTIKIPIWGKNIRGRFRFLFFFFKLILKYKYFVFLQAHWTLMKGYRDIKILRFFGKKCVVLLTGCDARVPNEVSKYKWNPCKNCPDEYKSLVNCNIPRKEKEIPQLPQIFSRVFSPHECSGLLNNNYSEILFPRPIKNFSPIYPSNNLKKIRILHAPSNIHYKGTIYIRKAIKELEKNLDNFEYIEVQGLQINELYEQIKSCDLVIDQIIGGFYGLFAVESMALGKPVVVYIYPDRWDKMKDAPIYNANPDNLFNVLEKILQNPEQLHVRGIAGRKYVEQYHDAKIVAGKIMNSLK